jgi:hypothetical protein
VWIRSETQQPRIPPTALLSSVCPRFCSMASVFKISTFAQNGLVMATVASFELMFGKHTIISPHSPGFDPQGSSCVLCCERSGTEVGFSPNISVLTHQLLYQSFIFIPVLLNVLLAKITTFYCFYQ